MPFSALSVGQRDVLPYYNTLTSHSLYMQVFRNEIANPQKLLTGNLDLAFVFVFLFPLFIIGMSYGIVSTEKENGTYPIIKTQPVSFVKIILIKLLFRFILVAIPVLLLSLTGVWITGASGFGAVGWLSIILTYLLFWIALCYWVVSLSKASAFNALVLLSIWMLLVVILPSLLNTIAVYRYPINQTQLTKVIRRIQLDESREGLYNVAVKYAEAHPEFKDSDTSLPNLMRKAYMIGGELGDDAARPKVQEYYGSIKERNGFVSAFEPFSPAVATQHALNYLACSDINSFLEYQEGVRSFHLQLVKFYHTPVLQKQLMTATDFQSQPAFKWTPEIYKTRVWKNFLILALWTTLFFVCGNNGFAKNGN